VDVGIERIDGQRGQERSDGARRVAFGQQRLPGDESDRTDPRVRRALAALAGCVESLRIFGSYPKAPAQSPIALSMRQPDACSLREPIAR
jgi:hypothetical protein